MKKVNGHRNYHSISDVQTDANGNSVDNANVDASTYASMSTSISMNKMATKNFYFYFNEIAMPRWRFVDFLGNSFIPSEIGIWGGGLGLIPILYSFLPLLIEQLLWRM